MQSEEDSARQRMAEQGSGANTKRFLIAAGILAAAVLAASFLLRQLVFVHLAAGPSALIALAVLVVFVWPGYVLFRRDTIIAQARRAEQSANQTELRMVRRVLDSLPDLIYIKDANSRFVLANRAIRTYMTGSPDGNLLGLDDSSFYPEEMAQAFRNDEQAVVRSGE